MFLQLQVPSEWELEEYIGGKKGKKKKGLKGKIKKFFKKRKKKAKAKKKEEKEKEKKQGTEEETTESYIGPEYSSDLYLLHDDDDRRRSEYTRIINEKIDEFNNENKRVESIIGEISSMKLQCTDSSEVKECTFATKMLQRKIAYNQLKIQRKMCKEEKENIIHEYKKAVAVDYDSSHRIGQKIINVLNFNTGEITKEKFGKYIS